MKIKFKGRLVKENTDWVLVCDLQRDNYSVSQRDISVVVKVNGKFQASLKEYFEMEIIE